ncbi:flagellar hook-basal body complex protein FliE [Pseudolysinimonas sp.]|jgi:flagellar hook-basal body complex protein FliE
MSGISGVSGVSPTAYLAPQGTGIQSVAGTAFGDALGSAIDGLSAAQQTSSQLTQQALSGDLSNIHDATIASSRAAVTLELVAAVRNKGVDAFTEIMRMQA